MKFIISRSSTWMDKKPCEEAQATTAVYVDRRTAKTLEEARGKHWGEEFFSRGTNHREEYGMIARDLEVENIWVVEIHTLEELLSLESKYGDLIIREQDAYKGYSLEIEIYDGYRE